ITEAFEENKNNILIEKCKLILFVVVLSLAIIVTYCTKGYVLFTFYEFSQTYKTPFNISIPATLFIF
ncbi:hypothetical protein ACTPEM_25555, partial [Clostridioides difficile]